MASIKALLDEDARCCIADAPAVAERGRSILTWQNFDAEMQSFFLLFNRYLTERAKGEKLYVSYSCYL